MTRIRIVAAIAAMVTAFLVQATLVGPLTVPVPVSVPAVLVALIALTDGPGVGLALGFGAGLVADLASDHPAGILALGWLVIGVVCGLCAAPNSSGRRDAAVAAAAAGAIATLAAVIVTLTQGSPGLHTVVHTAVDVVPAVLGDALLALALVWPVRKALRTETLRAPAPVLLIGGR